LARGTVDDGGHTFGKVDRSFGGTPSSNDLYFDIMNLVAVPIQENPVIIKKNNLKIIDLMIQQAAFEKTTDIKWSKKPALHKEINFNLLDLLNQYQINNNKLNLLNNNFVSSSIKRQQEVRKYVPRPIKSINKLVETFASYEEGLVYLNNQTVATINFTKNFPVAPYVVLTVEPTIDNQSNINVFGLTMPSLTSVLIGTSAPYTGFIRYRAAADSTYIWPRSAVSDYTSSMKIFSGEIVVVNDNSFVANFNFPVLPSGSVTILTTPYDAYFNSTANTGISEQNINPLSLTQFSSNTELSQYSTIKIHFIAFKV
jgi:hypothetical protein